MSDMYQRDDAHSHSRRSSRHHAPAGHAGPCLRHIASDEDRLGRGPVRCACDAISRHMGRCLTDVGQRRNRAAPASYQGANAGSVWRHLTIGRRRLIVSTQLHRYQLVHGVLHTTTISNIDIAPRMLLFSRSQRPDVRTVELPSRTRQT
jgi:hypothetical protein